MTHGRRPSARAIRAHPHAVLSRAWPRARGPHKHVAHANTHTQIHAWHTKPAHCAEYQTHNPLGIATVPFASATGATRLLRILHILTIQLRAGPHPRECQLRVRLAIDAPSVLSVICARAAKAVVPEIILAISQRAPRHAMRHLLPPPVSKPLITPQEPIGAAQ